MFHIYILLLLLLAEDIHCSQMVAAHQENKLETSKAGQIDVVVNPYIYVCFALIPSA